MAHFILAGQQLGSDHNIIDIGSGYFHCMKQTFLTIHTDVGSAAEIPGISFFRGMNFRIPLLFLILSGSRRSNKDWIHNGILFIIKPRCANSFSCRLFRIRRFRKRPSGSPPGIWITEFNSAEMWKHTVVDYLCYRGYIRLVIKTLQQVNSQYSFQLIGLWGTLSFVIAWLIESRPLFLGNDVVDLCKKFFARTWALTSFKADRLIFLFYHIF